MAFIVIKLRKYFSSCSDANEDAKLRDREKCRENSKFAKKFHQSEFIDDNLRLRGRGNSTIHNKFHYMLIGYSDLIQNHVGTTRYNARKTHGF